MKKMNLKNLKKSFLKTEWKKCLNKAAFIGSFVFFAGTSNMLHANNLNIMNVAVTGTTLTFDVSWENSWYASTAPSNWDAVWVFVKYQDCAVDNTWMHANLSTTSGNHSAGTPLTVDAVTDGKGVFIRRSSAGTGSIDTVSVSLKLTITAGTYNYEVFGIEMVKVLQENFIIGDGTSTSSFNVDTITAAKQASGISKTELGGGTTTDSIPPAYPMGYNAFYCMKYEITQKQFADFLNTLTYDQQKSKTIIAPNYPNGSWALSANGYYRNQIATSSFGTDNTNPAIYGSSYPHVACNFLSWGDVTAYLDWAALRPMTELEFEKTARGSLPMYPAEYIWGNNSLITQAYQYYWQIQNSGAVNEKGNVTGNGLAVYGASSYTSNGPLRVGSAASSTTSRVQAGASYYGVMDFGGNVWERVVSVDTSGSKFTGTLGDGALDANGNANVTNWPSSTTANGSGFRGGAWENAATALRTSDRQSATSVAAARHQHYGGRGVR